jgi:hypothetical protein
MVPLPFLVIQADGEPHFTYVTKDFSNDLRRKE